MKENDCISREQTIERLKLNFPISQGADNSRDRHRYMQALADIQAIREMPSVTPPLSSGLEKNSKKLEKDFGESDCISRAEALVAIRNLYPGMPRVDFNGSLRKWVDKYKPYIECDDAIKQLPSVTPQEPKTGHWIPTYGNVECSVCGSVKDSREVGKATHYCDFCGAKMVEPQESEDKECQEKKQ